MSAPTALPRRSGRLLNAPTRAIKAPYKTEGLYHEIHTWQNHALDGVGCHSSAVPHYRRSREADALHDAALTRARLHLKRGEYALADYWIEQAQHHDATEDQGISTVWQFFTATADACRQIVHAVESLFGRRRGR